MTNPINPGIAQKLAIMTARRPETGVACALPEARCANAAPPRARRSSHNKAVTVININKAISAADERSP
jgi:hypothetical protein